MTAPAPITAPSVVQLDRRVSRAIELGKGMRFEAADMDLLASLGLIDILHRAKTTYLKEQARCRDAKLRSIEGGNTSSGGTGRPTGLSAPPTSPSSGTIKAADVSGALQRARRKSVKR